MYLYYISTSGDAYVENEINLIYNIVNDYYTSLLGTRDTIEDSIMIKIIEQKPEWMVVFKDYDRIVSDRIKDKYPYIFKNDLF